MMVAISTATMARRLKTAFRADRTVAISALLHAVEVLDVDVGDGEYHDEDDVGERTRLAGVPLLEGLLVEVDGDQLGRRLRRHGVGDVEGLERLHRAEDQRDQEEWRNQRQRDPREGVPGP